MEARCLYPSKLLIVTQHHTPPSQAMGVSQTFPGNVGFPSLLKKLLNKCFPQGTQMDQDATDEKARKRAMGELVQSWMDRLQLISVIVGAISSRLIIL